MGRSRLPWFKVQATLPLHPKFRRLHERLKLKLFLIWCHSAREDVRGSIPQSLPVLADWFGGSYYHNLDRIVPRILEPLAIAGFLDRVNGWYSVHDWDYWQSQSSDKFPAEDSAEDATEDSGVANKGVKPKIPSSREIEKENRLILSDKSCGITSLFPDFELENIKAHGKSNGGDPRLGPLKEHIAAEWERERGCSISSAASKADWVRVADMLKRSRNDSMYSLQALRVSFTRFLCDPDRFVRKQGLAYWSRNAYRWLPDSLPQSVSSGKTVRSRVNVSLMADWWRDEGNG